MKLRALSSTALQQWMLFYRPVLKTNSKYRSALIGSLKIEKTKHQPTPVGRNWKGDGEGGREGGSEGDGQRTMEVERKEGRWIGRGGREGR